MIDVLPPRQSALLAYLHRHRREHGVVPSLAEMADHFGYRSQNAVVDLLSKLEAKGAIEREPGTRRSLRLLWDDPTETALGKPRPPHRIPLLGRIAAGIPITAGSDAAGMAEDFIDIDPALFDPPPNVFWRVQGESMIRLGILPNDLVGAALRSEFRNGQIVAAVITDPRTGDPELTLKRYQKRGHTITLTAENDDQDTYRPLVFDTRKDAIQIIGVYSGLIRPQGG